jgi:hypothetical protein
MALGGLLAVALAGAILARRRVAAGEMDDLEYDDDYDADEDEDV